MLRREPGILKIDNISFTFPNAQVRITLLIVLGRFIDDKLSPIFLPQSFFFLSKILDYMNLQSRHN
jgi:hypothetical protein